MYKLGQVDRRGTDSVGLSREGVGPPFRRAAIPKAVIQGLRGIVLDIVSYYVY